MSNSYINNNLRKYRIKDSIGKIFKAEHLLFYLIDETNFYLFSLSGTIKSK